MTRHGQSKRRLERHTWGTVGLHHPLVAVAPSGATSQLRVVEDRQEGSMARLRGREQTAISLCYLTAVHLDVARRAPWQHQGLLGESCTQTVRASCVGSRVVVMAEKGDDPWLS